MFSTCLFALAYFLKYGLFLVSYISGQNKFPKPLSPSEERALLDEMAQGSESARHTLIERNLRLVAHIANKYKHVAGCDEDDLISIGTIGLMKAVSSFNGHKQARLATYASRCIENEILMTIRAGRKLKNEVSLSECLGHDAEGNEVTFMDILPAEDEDIAEKIGTDMEIRRMYGFLKEKLPPREQEIIFKRYGIGTRPRTQQEIAKEMGISRSYVSRIEKKALDLLAKCFKETAKKR